MGVANPVISECELGFLQLRGSSSFLEGSERLGFTVPHLIPSDKATCL